MQLIWRMEGRNRVARNIIYEIDLKRITSEGVSYGFELN